MELEEAVTELAPGLLRYCLASTGEPALAEDIAQEALTALVARWRRRGPPDSPAAFVFAIARRRAWRARIRAGVAGKLGFGLDGHRPPASPEARALARDRFARAVAAMRRLPGRDREALALVAAGELPLQEGARILGTSVPALKMRLHRARRRLAALLEEDDG